jgi:hypothetical protein
MARRKKDWQAETRLDGRFHELIFTRAISHLLTSFGHWFFRHPALKAAARIIRAARRSTEKY